jgi:hypothetical protein
VAPYAIGRPARAGYGGSSPREIGGLRARYGRARDPQGYGELTAESPIGAADLIDALPLAFRAL